MLNADRVLTRDMLPFFFCRLGARSAAATACAADAAVAGGPPLLPSSAWEGAACLGLPAGHPSEPWPTAISGTRPYRGWGVSVSSGFGTHPAPPLPHSGAQEAELKIGTLGRGLVLMP